MILVMRKTLLFFALFFVTATLFLVAGQMRPAHAEKSVAATLSEQITGTRRGWGVVDISTTGEHTIKTYTLPPGSWLILAPVTVRGGYTPSGIDIRFTPPQPTPVQYSNASVQPQPNGQPFPGDNQFTVWVWIVCKQPTKVSLLVETYFDDSYSEVLDGDSLVFGAAS